MPSTAGKTQPAIPALANSWAAEDIFIGRRGLVAIHGFGHESQVAKLVRTDRPPPPASPPRAPEPPAPRMASLLLLGDDFPGVGFQETIGENDNLGA